MTTAATCPKCGSSDFRYSQRRLKDGLLRMLFSSAFRCHSCGHRHFRVSGASLAVAVTVLLFVAFLIGIGRIYWTYYA